MSQKMSVSYNNSLEAAKAVQKEFPGRKLVVEDTRCISGGLGLLVRRAVDMMENGAAFDEVRRWVESHKLRIAHRFTVDDLKYLKAGGRVSNFSALVGTVLSIKPVLYVPDAGTLDVAEKVRGRKAALNCIVKGVLRDLEGMDANGLEFDINHADCQKDAEYVRDEIKKVHPEIGRVSITGLGVVIGAHCGPGLLAVFYQCRSRNP
jgi:DegV family protein with EDD domain